MPALETERSDATQRVNINEAGQPTGATARQSRPAQRPAPLPSARERAAARKRKERQTILTVAISAAVVLVIVLVILGISLFRAPADNGQILNNVFAAGVNIGGMTPEQAKKALHDATDKTYTVLNMSVRVLDTEIKLAPGDTGARLDVDAVVEAAYNYGRTGSRAEQQQAQKLAQTSSYTLSILPYLNLNTNYIQNTVAQLGNKYSTTRTPTVITLEGQRPEIGAGKQDTTVAHQTLTITKGTAEYGLSTNALYIQILDAYNIGLFEVVGNCTVVAPDPYDFDTLYEESNLYSAPVDATWNEDSYSVDQEEIYGYGIAPDALKAIVDAMEYGTQQTVPLYFIKPDITSDVFAQNAFTDTLASHTTPLSENADWNHNLQLVCQILNDYIIKSDEEFSFNQVVGETSVDEGYRSVKLYVGKQYREVEGGGICQIATALYNCALLSDLPILERNAHSYAPDFVNPGFDAEVFYGSLDLRFMNNTGAPLRIQASVNGDYLVVKLVGTDHKDYTVEITTKTDKIKYPTTVYNNMSPDNPGGYKDGDVLVEGITGFTVSTYMSKYSRDTGRRLSEDLITTSYYAKLDKVVVKIELPEPPPTEPTVPTDPTVPTPPTDPTDPTDTTDPTESTGATESTESTEETESTAATESEE